MNYIELFQNLGFPIAVCVVLFSIQIYFFKKTIAIIEDMMQKIQEERKQNNDYLQSSNKELSQVISRNTDTLARFSGLMVIVSKLIKKQNSNNE